MSTKAISVSVSVDKKIFSHWTSTLVNGYKSALQTGNEFLHSLISSISRRIKSRRTSLNYNTQSSKNIFAKVLDLSKRGSKGKLKTLLIIVAGVLVLAGGVKLVSKLVTSGNSGQRIEIKGAKAVQEINKEFTFPLRDGDGKELGKIKYLIERAELREEIVVKGQRATAVKGRTFLILTLKITNDYKQPIEMDTKDYVRLSVNNNEGELLAPDIHNDPVEIQAISTKYTRIGFPINESDKNLFLSVGEINGEKEKIALNLN